MGDEYAGRRRAIKKADNYSYIEIGPGLSGGIVGVLVLLQQGIVGVLVSVSVASAASIVDAHEGGVIVNCGYPGDPCFNQYRSTLLADPQ